MDTIIRGEPDSQIAQSWNKGKLTGAKPPSSPETCMGNKNAPAIGKPS